MQQSYFKTLILVFKRCMKREEVLELRMDKTI